MNAILIPKTKGLFSYLRDIARKAAGHSDTIITVNLDRVLSYVRKNMIKKVIIFTGSRSYTKKKILSCYETYKIIKSENNNQATILIDDRKWPVPVSESIIIPDLNIIDKIKSALI